MEGSHGARCILVHRPIGELPNLRPLRHARPPLLRHPARERLVGARRRQMYLLVARDARAARSIWMHYPTLLEAGLTSFPPRELESLLCVAVCNVCNGV